MRRAVQALRENMATLEQAGENPEFSPQKRTTGIAVRLYLELLDEYRDVINYVFLERCKVCVAELIKEAALGLAPSPGRRPKRRHGSHKLICGPLSLRVWESPGPMRCSKIKTW